MTLLTSTSKHFGLTIKEHRLPVPWDHEQPGETFELFARELVPTGGEDLPVLVYLQGGPGFPSPRPLGDNGLIGEALKHFRVLLLDQRGTGRSARIDDRNLRTDLLHLLRQEHIVRDAELLREALELKTWSLFGQSFGGFCITTYQSMFPESIDRAFLTGGLPGLYEHVDDIYRTTFDKLRRRHELFYREYPWADDRIREICHHLDNSAESLPTGERLSSRRFRTIGMNLGRGVGFHSLAYLLEDPFTAAKGEKRLKTDFLNNVGQQVSFAGAPLYAAIHESIYGGLGVNASVPTGWAAHRVREEIPGFEELADPSGDAPFYLTGEHIFPWQFDEDPSLHGFKEAADTLAERAWDASPYDPSALKERSSLSAAAIYLDDIFVPFEQSRQTAETYRDLRPFVTNLHQHDGIGAGGAAIFAQLLDLANDH
ncbi:alpha/beta fold hydrolase [Corynebacterium gerontici]|uniref:Proline iminopeptidase n=1 Tax=Corynebacterium gerontici TaxID=2079234 RepID=A0A3G6J7A5_9CORY|nr:alpha/beta fold hydrolase [Corynebacterium gerontici]AZA11914.1 Proline iminopeptidase [Corynebacterium gerontici]